VIDGVLPVDECPLLQMEKDQSLVGAQLGVKLGEGGVRLTYSFAINGPRKQVQEQLGVDPGLIDVLEPREDGACELRMSFDPSFLRHFLGESFKVVGFPRFDGHF